MKKFVLLKISLLSIVLILLSGCANGLESMSIPNEYVVKNNLPYSYIKYKEDDKATYYGNVKVRGKIGKSIVENEILLNDIMSGIRKNCGFSINDLKEIRLIEHKFPIYKEIWVFRDKNSERKDKSTAMGLKLIQVPNNGGTDIVVSGGCPSKITHFIYGK